jgi:hypothetical protein
MNLVEARGLWGARELAQIPESRRLTPGGRSRSACFGADPDGHNGYVGTVQQMGREMQQDECQAGVANRRPPMIAYAASASA